MALFFDGFEQFDKAENIGVQMRKAGYVVGGDITAGQGRIGGRSLITYRASITRTLEWTGNLFSMGFAAKFTGRGGLCSFPGVGLIMDAKNGLPSFLGVTGGSIPTKGKWYYYEWELDRAARTVTLYINGKQNGVGQMPDTLAGATNVPLTLNAYGLPTSVGAEPGAGSADTATRTFDDLYLYEGPRLTPVQVTTRFPTKDERKEWQVLPDDISHAEAVGKLPSEELDRYILSNKEGATDMFSSSTKLPDNKRVIAIGAVGLVRKTDANSGSIDFRVGMRAQAVTDITTDWRYKYVTWLADGDTADSVNNSQMGVTAHIGS